MWNYNSRYFCHFPLCNVSINRVELLHSELGVFRYDSESYKVLERLWEREPLEAQSTIHA